MSVALLRRRWFCSRKYRQERALSRAEPSTTRTRRSGWPRSTASMDRTRRFSSDCPAVSGHHRAHGGRGGPGPEWLCWATQAGHAPRRSAPSRCCRASSSWRGLSLSRRRPLLSSFGIDNASTTPQAPPPLVPSDPPAASNEVKTIVSLRNPNGALENVTNLSVGSTLPVGAVFVGNPTFQYLGGSPNTIGTCTFTTTSFSCTGSSAPRATTSSSRRS